MTLFSLIDHTQVHLAAGMRIIKQDDYQKIQDIQQIIQKTIDDTASYKQAAITEVEKAKEQAKLEGYQEGLARWSEELAKVHEEIDKIKEEYEKIILRTAMMAAQKFVGRELKIDPQALVDIVKVSLKAVAQHKRISIYCSPKDLEVLDQARPQLKTLFEELEVLGVYAKDSLEPGSYIIETERGIINHSELGKVWEALEKAFENVLKSAGERAPVEVQS